MVAFAGLKANAAESPDFESFVKPLFAEKCVKCHGGGKVKGKVNLKKLESLEHVLAQPELIKEAIEVVEVGDMPPEDEPGLDERQRTKLVAELKSLLRASVAADETKKVRMRRLNRFQYNNAIRDLFKMNRDVFALPEKLMTRHTDYLREPSGKLPDTVNASCLSLRREGGMKDVDAFPKDLRAAHGFDNQANQLTLSPLLFDSFLKLSVSILESPDFNEGSVGSWNDFFKEPEAGADLKAEVRNRLVAFLWRAFRGPVDGATIDRYTRYAVEKMEEGLSFTDGMKKVASAALSSPMFLYRYESHDPERAAFELATKLSFFLWSSGPDLELLRLAKTGELSKPEVLNRTIDRMFADPKIERFLDAFPSQWMQLENVLAATPDPKKARYFSLDREHPASLQMVLEPLLLFDAVFVENRPIAELISPTFGYQSEFLRDWYTSDFKPPPFDEAKVIAQNKARDEERRKLNATIEASRAGLKAIEDPVRARLLAAAAKNRGKKKVVDLKPFAVWEFNGDLKEEVRGLHLKAHGKIRFEDGMIVLKNKTYLQSDTLDVDLKAKTLEVWLKVHDINQRGGGAMGIQGPGDFFDTIVLGERKHRHWISGSNGFARTLDFPESTPEEKPNERLHLAMVYQENGTTKLYRNGKPYGRPYRKGAATFPKHQTSVIFGARHLPPGGNRHLSMSLARARLYDRALTAEEVAASGDHLHVPEKELVAAFTPAQRSKREELKKNLAQAEEALRRVPKNEDLRQARGNHKRRYEDQIRNKMRAQTFKRVAANDPRYGGVITNAAMLSMTSGPRRTHPIARGAWIIEVILNDPPPPPPNDVPPLNEDDGDKDLTIREKFAEHRKNPDCAGCHARLDPLGFALENFDITGRWRDKYENGRDVDASGTVMKKHPFDGIVGFKEALVKEHLRFAKAFIGHLMRFALARELTPGDSLAIDSIVGKAAKDDLRLKAVIRELILSDRFTG